MGAGEAGRIVSTPRGVSEFRGGSEVTTGNLERCEEMLRRVNSVVTQLSVNLGFAGESSEPETLLTFLTEKFTKILSRHTHQSRPALAGRERAQAPRRGGRLSPETIGLTIRHKPAPAATGERVRGRRRAGRKLAVRGGAQPKEQRDYRAVEPGGGLVRGAGPAAREELKVRRDVRTVQKRNTQRLCRPRRVPLQIQTGARREECQRRAAPQRAR